ncbi:Aldoxime dehydratase [Pseudonocardia sp. Ae717_Ps2]|nr:Aldoxime dehydratase [Pseudonocardia sp. Ae717_Ps2]
MESAIDTHLQCPRTLSRRVADEYQPPFPMFVARAGSDLTQVVMGYFGVQYHGDDHRAEALSTLRHIVGQFALPDGPGEYDTTEHTDAQDHVNLIAVGYWRDPATYERWLSGPDVADWWNSDERLSADTRVVGLTRPAGALGRVAPYAPADLRDLLPCRRTAREAPALPRGLGLRRRRPVLRVHQLPPGDRPVARRCGSDQHLNLPGRRVRTTRTRRLLPGQGLHTVGLQSVQPDPHHVLDVACLRPAGLSGARAVERPSMGTQRASSTAAAATRWAP